MIVHEIRVCNNLILESAVDLVRSAATAALELRPTVKNDSSVSVRSVRSHSRQRRVIAGHIACSTGAPYNYYLHYDGMKGTTLPSDTHWAFWI